MGKRRGRALTVIKGLGYSDARRTANKTRKLKRHLNFLLKKKKKLEAKGPLAKDKHGNIKIIKEIDKVEGYLTA